MGTLIYRRRVTRLVGLCAQCGVPALPVFCSEACEKRYLLDTLFKEKRAKLLRILMDSRRRFESAAERARGLRDAAKKAEDVYREFVGKETPLDDD